MHYDVYNKISLAAEKLGTSKRSIVIMLLTKIRYDIDKFQGGFTLVEYQPRDPYMQWHCFTIIFNKQENELVSDFRRLGKLSVSYFVAKAVEYYLNELLNKGKTMHNYVILNHYVISQSIVNGIICWEYYWGNPGPTPRNRTNTKIHRRLEPD
jgi:hypothetical protein